MNHHVLKVVSTLAGTAILMSGCETMDTVNQSIQDAGKSVSGVFGSADTADATGQTTTVGGTMTDQLSDSDMAELTRQIQVQLTQRGYRPGTTDGVAGKQTRDAICHYQFANGLAVNPRPTAALLDGLKQSPGTTPAKDYPGIVQHQCDIAHINSLSEVDAVAMHTYEGVLNADDLVCKQVVSPYSISSNLDPLFSSVLENAVAMLKGDAKELKLDEVREKAKKANWMPQAVELEYGESIHEERMSADVTILNRDSKRRDIRKLYEKGDAVLAHILEGVNEPYPYEFKVFVVDDESLNAEAIPGGYLYINSGVLKTDFADLVVSHEIAHVLRRHTTLELQATLIDSVDTVQDLKSLLTMSSKDPEAISERVMVLRSAIMRYSQQQELQADACAVRLAIASGDADVDIRIDGFMEELQSNQSAVSKTVSTHPAYTERKAHMKSVYNEITAQ